MSQPSNPILSIVGTGRVAAAFGKALVAKGVSIKEIIGRDQGKVEALAEQLGASPAALGAMDNEIDLLIVAVRDDAIAEVSALLPQGDYIRVHTSGSVALKVMGEGECGSIWPMYSFAQPNTIPADIPLCVTGSSANSLEIIRSLAGIISDQVFTLSEEERSVTHIAAVLGNNFSNHIFSQAFDLLKQHGLDPEIIKPLLIQTVELAMLRNGEGTQTGPAARGEMEILADHMAFLEKEHPNLTEVYRVLSDSIRNQQA
jgi:predicted short-subunit dehydrogenase-like oxidoreductase (DUF2520 family)